MIRKEKISIQHKTQEELDVLSNACKMYQDYLELLCNTENKSQHHIHHSINQEYGYMLLGMITRRKIQKKSSIEVHTAFIVSDGLRYYIDATQNVWEKSVAIRIQNEIFQELPHTRDITKYSLISESGN